MSSFAASNSEPLTLFTRADLVAIYDRDSLFSDLATGRLARQRVDRFIAKVLPAQSSLVVEPYDDVVCRVVDCAYRPYFEKQLFAIHGLLEPVARHETPQRHPPPEVKRVIDRALELVGTPYLFGGSAPQGSAAQERALVRFGFFQSADLAHPELRQIARSTGIDCSGLFNWATEYSFFGDSKDVYHRLEHGLLSLSGTHDAATIARALEPLDIVIFRGHMMLALPEGRIIQAVGDGRNAESFACATGHRGPAFEKYNRVVIDDAEPILDALLRIQGRRFSSTWHLDDAHFMVVRYRVAAQ